MGAWGLSQEGKNARDLMTQIGREGLVQANNNNYLSMDAWNQGNFTVNDAKNRLKQMADAGYITPQQATQYATQLVGGQDQGPWGAMMGRENALDTQRAGMPTAADTMGGVQANQQAKLDAINKEYGLERPMSDTTYGTLRDRSENAFGTLRDWSNAGYDTMGQQSDQATQDQTRRVQARMDSDNASVAQAGAPQMASAMRSLRAAGIDPNSAEGQERIQAVQGQQARGFDANIAGNIDRTNALQQQGMMNRQGLEQQKLANQQGLVQGQLQNLQGLSTQQLNSSLGLGQGQLANTLDVYNQAAQNPLLARQIAQQDYGLATTAADRKNAIDQSQYGDLYQRAGLGMQYGDKDLAAKQWATGGYLNAGVGQGNQGLQWQNASQAGQQAAFGANQNLYNQAAQNSGWGWQMLGQGAGAALSMF